MRNIVLEGHVLDQLKLIPEKSVQTIITSPPYWGLRAYGTPPQIWDGDKNCEHDWNDFVHVRHPGQVNQTLAKGSTGVKEAQAGVNMGVCKTCGAWKGELGQEPTIKMFVNHLVEIFRECRRVLRDDGTLWVNMGDSYAGSNNGSNDHREQNASISRNDNKYGNHRPGKGELKPKDLCMIPARMAIALCDDGWYLRQDIIWAKPNPMPESVTDRCTKSHEYIFLLSKNKKYYYDAKAIKEPVSESFANDGRHKTGSTNNHVKEGYVENGAQDPKGPHRMYGKHKNLGDKGLQNHSMHERRADGLPDEEYLMRNKRSVWTITTKPYSGAHFATFPPEIPELCIKAGSKKGDIVMDIFGGSGTTATVAKRMERDYITIELNPKYVSEHIKPRLENINPLGL